MFGWAATETWKSSHSAHPASSGSISILSWCIARTPMATRLLSPPSPATLFGLDDLFQLGEPDLLELRQ